MNKKLAKLAVGLALMLPIVLSLQSHGTVSGTTSKTVTALGNGVTTNYTIGFSFRDNDDIVVIKQDESTTPYTQTTLVYGAGASKFTITGGDPGTTVVLGTAPTSSQRIIIKRVTPKTQPVDYEETAAFPAQDHETQMDKNTYLLQEVSRDLDTKIGLSGTSTYTTPTFPDPVANKFIGYNSGASNLTLYPSATPSTDDVLRFDGSAWVPWSTTPLVTLGNSFSSLTSGSVLFSSGGSIGQNNANFYWNDNNARLGIGTTAPGYKLDVSGTLNATGNATLGGTLGVTSNLAVNTNKFNVTASNGNTSVAGTLSVTGQSYMTGNVGIGSTSPSAKLHIKASNSLATLGTEKITDPADQDFSTDTTNWSGIGWSIGSGLLSHSAGANAVTLKNTALDSAPADTKTYQIVLTVDTSTPGTMKVGIGGVDYGYVYFTGTVTNYTVVVQAGSGGVLTLTPDAAWVGTIDNVSVKEVTSSDYAAVVEASNGSSNNLEVRVPGSGLSNYALGVGTLKNTISGSGNIALGANALRSKTTGAQNIAIGTNALYTINAGADNVAIGYQANARGTDTTANVVIGSTAGQYLQSSNNIAIGYAALTGSAANPVSGISNVFIGRAAGYVTTTASQNTGIGRGNLSAVTTGGNNVALGYLAGDTLTTGTGNIRIGHDADGTKVDAIDSIAIGRASRANHSNAVVIGASVASGNDYDFILGNSSHVVQVPGKVGIGTTAPNQKLEINPATGTAAMRIAANSTTSYGELTDVSAGSMTINKTTASGAGSATMDINPLPGDGSSAASVRLFRSTNTSGTKGFSLLTGDNTANSSIDMYASTSAPAMMLQGYGSIGGFHFRRANGTATSKTKVLGGNSLGQIYFRGYEETTPAYTNSVAQIEAQAEQDFTSSAQGSRLVFSTTTSGTTTQSERMRIDNAGNVGIGTTAPGEKLEVNGSVKATGLKTTNLLVSSSAPTVTGGCTSKAVQASNGTGAFTVAVGTGCSGSQPIVVALPTATTGWNCFAGHRTAATANTGTIVQTAVSTTSATLTNVSAGSGVAWTDNEVLQVSCFAY